MWHNGRILIVARLRVYDDLAEQTFVVNLEDVVRSIDDQNDPGKHRAVIVALVNEHILDRHPHVTKAKTQELAVGIEEFSDVKIQVIQQLLLLVGATSGKVM